MPTTVEYSNNPNEETAFVTPEGGQRTRTVLTTPVDGTVKYPDNPNSTKVSVVVDGVARKAVAVYNVGGGGDSHNLGWYATSSDLQTAHPTASAGDWAIVGATDTVWVWDTDTSAWVDTDTKGQVTSVNNQTGAVTIGANDVLPTQTGYSGRVLGTDGFVAGWVKPEIVQRSALPVASQDEEGNIYQFVGTTDANYTNGYFYECVSDGATPPVYSWTRVDVQPAGSSLPTQTGNAGKFLTTDGTDASWGNAVQNTATGTSGLGILGTTSGNQTVVIGDSADGSSYSGVVIEGYNARATSYSSVAIGSSSSAHQSAVAVGKSAAALGVGSIQLGQGTNNTAGTFQVGLTTNGYSWTQYELLSSDGTIPTARLTNAINKYSSMPTAGADYLGQIAQFTGTTDATYTHGYIYECVSDGGNPPTYSWTAVSVQAGSGSSLPSQTGNAGKFLTTDGTDASWGDLKIGTSSRWISVGEIGSNMEKLSAIRIGYLGPFASASDTLGTYSVSIGDGAHATAQYGIAIGTTAKTSGQYAIQLGGAPYAASNPDANTFKVYNGNGNFEMMDANGNLPADRLASTTGLADGNYKLRLTMSNGTPTLTWVAE